MANCVTESTEFVDADDCERIRSNGQLARGSHGPIVKSLCINYNTFNTALNVRGASLSRTADTNDPRASLFHFVTAAHPDPAAAIRESFDEFMGLIPGRFEHSLMGTLQSQVEIIESVPGPANPVEAILVYAQSPSRHDLKLTLAWKLEVEMLDDRHETHAGVLHGSRIRTVIDWASDMPTLKPHPNNLRFTAPGLSSDLSLIIYRAADQPHQS
jgi:hypothetical protein